MKLNENLDVSSFSVSKTEVPNFCKVCRIINPYQDYEPFVKATGLASGGWEVGWRGGGGVIHAIRFNMSICFSCLTFLSIDFILEVKILDKKGCRIELTRIHLFCAVTYTYAI